MLIVSADTSAAFDAQADAALSGRIAGFLDSRRELASLSADVRRAYAAQAPRWGRDAGLTAAGDVAQCAYLSCLLHDPAIGIAEICRRVGQPLKPQALARIEDELTAHLGGNA